MSDPATGLTTLDLVKVRLNIKVSTDDVLIKDLIEEATDEIEVGIGARIIKAEYTDTLDGSSLGALVLLHRPVIDFEELVLNGTAVDATTYEVDKAAGTIELVTDGVKSSWVDGTRNYVATYTAGYEEIPAGLLGIATNIVARRTLATTKDRIGVSAKGLPSGGSTDYESAEITDEEWKKLRGYGRRA